MPKVWLPPVVLCLLCGTVPALSDTGTLKVYNWTDYIDPALIEAFEAETGLDVIYDVFDSNEILEAKLLAGQTGYDVVVPSANFLERQIASGVFQPLDKSRLTNLEHAWDAINDRTDLYDPGGVYSVNYMWGTTGIGYNVEAVEARLGVSDITSWDVIFEPSILARFTDCGIYLLDTAGEMFPAAMNFLGIDPNSKEPDDIERAGALLAQIRPFVTNFHSSAYINALASGDACLAVGWSGDVLQARDRAHEAGRGVEIRYAIPHEGAQMWFDQMAIPRDAPNPDAAHLFIDFMLRPDVIAAASNYVRYANGNKTSQAMLDDDLLNDPATYVPPDVMERLYVVSASNSRITRLFSRLWTRVKAGQ